MTNPFADSLDIFNRTEYFESDLDEVIFRLDKNFTLLNSSFNQTWLNETEPPYPSSYSTLHIIIASIILTLIMIVVVVGNMLVIIAIATEKALKNIQNWFIASLAVSDFFVGLIIMPFSLAKELMGYWIFGDWWCDIHSAMDVLLCTASIMNICLISLDRYWSITQAVEYLKTRTPARAALMIAMVWVLSGLISIPPLLGWREERPPETYPKCEVSDELGYVLYSALGSFYIPSCIMVFVYIRIYFAARARARRGMKRPRPRPTGGSGPTTTTSVAAPPADKSTTTTTTTSFSVSSAATKVEIVEPPPSNRASSVKKKVTLQVLPQTSPSPGSQTRMLTAMQDGPASDSGNVCTVTIVTPPSDNEEDSPKIGGDCPPTYAECTQPTYDDFDEEDSSVVQSSPPPLSPTEPIPTVSYSVQLAEDPGGADNQENGRAVKERNAKGQSAKETLKVNQLGSQFRGSTLSINGDIHILGTMSRSSSRIFDNECVSDVDPSSSDSGTTTKCAVVKPLKLRLCQPIFGKRTSKAKREVIDMGKIPQKPRDPEKEKRRIARKKEKRATLILGLIMGSFILSWLPFFALYIFTPMCPFCHVADWAFAIAFWLGYMNSALNPVIYTIFNKDFRRAFRRILFK